MNSHNGTIIVRDSVATDTVLDIMRSSVSSESYDKYMGQNINFMLWLYNNDELCEDILHDWMIEKLHAAKREDDSSDATKKSHTNQRKACKEAIDGIRKGDSSTFPLLFRDLHSMCFHTILQQRKRRMVVTFPNLPMVVSVALLFIFLLFVVNRSSQSFRKICHSL